jgi:hypothetical protein
MSKKSLTTLLSNTGNSGFPGFEKDGIPVLERVNNDLSWNSYIGQILDQLCTTVTMSKKSLTTLLSNTGNSGFPGFEKDGIPVLERVNNDLSWNSYIGQILDQRKLGVDFVTSL